MWLSFSSVFLAFVFVFGNSLRNMYESVIFLFVMHPYDVGDALFISGDWCQVEEIALQYTQVVRYDGVKIWYPNYVLCAGAVMNITRSAKRWESFKVLLLCQLEAILMNHIAGCCLSTYLGGLMVSSEYAMQLFAIGVQGGSSMELIPYDHFQECAYRTCLREKDVEHSP